MHENDHFMVKMGSYNVLMMFMFQSLNDCFIRWINDLIHDLGPIKIKDKCMQCAYKIKKDTIKAFYT